MANCSDLYVLSTIACRLTECLSEREAEILAAELVALGEMLELSLAQKSACEKD